MKKTLAILLALILVLVNVAALASEAEEPKYKASKAFTFEPLTKIYTVTGTEDEDLYPQEVLEFEVTASTDNPDKGAATITVGDENTVTVTSVDGTILPINVPALSLPGLYHFTVKEKTGNTQGVTYATNEIEISVLVTFSETEADQLEVVDTEELKNYGVKTKGEGDKKVDEIENEYALGELEIEKEVTGNLGDRNQLFDIKVTFEADGDVLSVITVETESTGTNPATVGLDAWKDGKAEIDIQLKHGETLTFKDIPEGVSYTVAEAEKHAADDSPNYSDGSKGYTVTYDGETGDIEADTTAKAKITNEKKIDIDTGISMETVPYIMILALALIGVAVLSIRKREEY